MINYKKAKAEAKKKTIYKRLNKAISSWNQ